MSQPVVPDHELDKAILAVLDQMVFGDRTATMPMDGAGPADAIRLTMNLINEITEYLSSQLSHLGTSIHRLEAEVSLLTRWNQKSASGNRKLNEVNRRLEETMAQSTPPFSSRAELMTTMTHELRTPLSNLIMLTEHLKADPGHTLTDAQIQMASLINKSGTDLLSQLNRTLDSSAPEQRQLTPK